MMRLLLLSLLGLCIATPTFGQEIANLRAELVGDSVRISYDLEDPSANRTYRVAVKGIMDNDTVALKELSGSLGDSIRAGSHEVWWDFVKEKGRYKGTVAFYVQALPDFYITAPDTGKVVKRGKPITFRWYGGNAQYDTLHLELYQYDKRLDSVAVVANATQYTWKVPTNLAPDAGYRIKVIGSDKTQIEDFSNEFAVKRQYPQYVIFVPAALAVGTLVWGIVTDWWKLPPPDIRGRPGR